MPSPSAFLKKIKQYEEYADPAHDCSMFMLPDGSMFGMWGIFQHNTMVETIFPGKLILEKAWRDIMILTKVIRIVISHGDLHIEIFADLTCEQIRALRGLVNCGKYSHVYVECHGAGKNWKEEEARICSLLRIPVYS